MTSDRLRLLYTEDVARLWTEERRRVDGPDADDVKIDRVYDFYKWSKPTRPGVQNRNRYENFPMPYAEATRPPFTDETRPDRRRTAPGRRRAVQPAWHADQEQDLRDWWHERLTPAEHEEAGQRRKAVWDEKFTYAD